METRYVPVTSECVEALAAAVDRLGDDRLRRAAAEVVRAYETSTVACLHARVLRAGSSRKCLECGSWL